MTANLMDSVKGMFTPEMLGKASEAAGEPPEATRRAMNAGVPTIFAGLAQGASTPTGASRVFSMLGESGASGPSLMNKIFGDRAGAVSETLGQSSGISGRSSSRVLAFLLPMVTGFLGKEVLSRHLNAGGLSQLLLGQKKAILDDPNTPRGLSGALGMGNLSELGGTATSVTEPHVSSAPAPMTERTREVGAAAAPRSSASRLLIPLVLLGAVILGIALTRAHRAPRVGVTAPQPTMPAAPHVETPHVQTPQVQAPQVQAPTVGTPTAGAIALPGGKTLNVPSNSPQADMARTLGDNSKALPQSFAFDDLAFDPGSATPTAASTKTVDDIAAMLQAYPSARIRIKGHTDATGTPAANRALSASRASTLKDMLVARGVDPNRIETTGASEQGAQLRRAEIEVLSR